MDTEEKQEVTTPVETPQQPATNDLSDKVNTLEALLQKQVENQEIMKELLVKNANVGLNSGSNITTEKTDFELFTETVKNCKEIDDNQCSLLNFWQNPASMSPDWQWKITLGMDGIQAEELKIPMETLYDEWKNDPRWKSHLKLLRSKK